MYEEMLFYKVQIKKNFIYFFRIIFYLIILYSLSYTRVVRKVLGVARRWRKYLQITMIFFKCDSLNGVLRNFRSVRLVVC